MKKRNALLFVILALTSLSASSCYKEANPADKPYLPTTNVIRQMKSEVEDRYIQVSGIKIHYLKAGSGYHVILIHGLGAFAETWLYNIKPLSKQYTVYAPDVVGFGRSDRPNAEYSPPYFVAFLASFMRALNIKKASLVGNSMGGLIALQFTINYPDRVDKLVLVDSAGLGRGVSLGLRLLSIPIIGDIMVARTSKKSIRRGLYGSFYNPGFVTDEWVKEASKISRIPGTKRAFLKTVRGGVNIFGLKRNLVLVDKLSCIQTPTLIIWGKQDRVIPVKHAYIAHKMIKNSQLHIFDECGHAPQVEKAEEFNKLVLEFLNNGN